MGRYVEMASNACVAPFRKYTCLIHCFMEYFHLHSHSMSEECSVMQLLSCALQSVSVEEVHVRLHAALTQFGMAYTPLLHEQINIKPCQAFPWACGMTLHRVQKTLHSETPACVSKDYFSKVFNNSTCEHQSLHAMLVLHMLFGFMAL